MGPEAPVILGPQKKTSKDHVTAHKVALLVLVREFCMVKNKARLQKPFVSVEDDTWVQTNRHHRDFAIHMLKFIQSPDMDLKQLDDISKIILHPRTYSLFTEKLQDLRNQGVAGIMDYVLSLETLLVDPQHPTPIIHKSSVLGLFVRRMLLAFDKLSFSQVIQLHRNYCRYYDAAFGSASTEESMCADTSLMDEERNEESHVFASQKQAEFFIAQQAVLLHINEKESLPPSQLQQRIRELLKGNPELAEALYLSFLNNLRVKEYCGAIDSLFHHFDHNAVISQDPKPGSGNEEHTRSFRYAALNLAMLHAKFGHRDEAIAALREAITMAQESNDNICLQHALAWLYLLTPDDKEMLVEHSVTKSGELNLWYLSSLGIQALTQLKALSVAEPSQVFDTMIKSDILDCQHSMTELMGSAYSLRASLWNIYGNRAMATASSLLLLHLNTSDPVHGGVYHTGEGTCIALCNLAWGFALQGQYAPCGEILQLARDLFPPRSEHARIWTLCDRCIRFEKALYHGKWQEAAGSVAGIEILDPEEGACRQAELHMHRGDWTDAHRCVLRLLKKCREAGGPPAHFHLRVLLLQAELFCWAANYAAALPPLARALSVCRDHHLLYYEALTYLHLAEVQLMLNLPSQALHLLDQALLNLLGHGSLYGSARVHLLYAKCLIAVSKFGSSASSRRKALEAGVCLAGKAVNQFRQVEAVARTKEALYWQALMYNELGCVNQRNACSRQLRLLDQQLGPDGRDASTVL